MAMASVLKRMGRDDITVHGFRSTFRDWAAERTNYPNHVVEQALAHVIGNAVEARLSARRPVREARAADGRLGGFCTSPAQAGEVVPMRARR